jgi:acyl carrier protein
MYKQREKLGPWSSIPASPSAAELDDRLVRCISSVLPTLAEEEIRSAEVQQLVDADSLTAVTLVALINDEFGLDLDLEVLLKLGNFKRICGYLVSSRCGYDVERTED